MTKMMNFVHVIILSLLITAACHGRSLIQENCAAYCDCITNKHYQTVISCKDSSRISPPNIIPDNTSIMDLTGINTQELSAASWHGVDLSKIRNLYLTNISLSHIYADAFTVFSSKLQKLDLSGNSLQTDQLVAALRFLKGKRMKIIVSIENYEEVKKRFPQHLVLHPYDATQKPPEVEIRSKEDQPGYELPTADSHNCSESNVHNQSVADDLMKNNTDDHNQGPKDGLSSDEMWIRIVVGYFVGCIIVLAGAVAVLLYKKSQKKKQQEPEERATLKPDGRKMVYQSLRS